MSKEIMVPINLINETLDNTKSNDSLIAYLENGMTTEVFVKENGKIYTNSDDDSLIKYLCQDNEWNGLKVTTKLSDNNLIIRAFQEEDLEHLGAISTGSFGDDIDDDDNYTNIMMKKIAKQIPMRGIRMALNAVTNKDEADMLVVVYRGEVIGNVVYNLINGVMNLKLMFKNTNLEEVQAAAKAIKMIMRKLSGTFNFDVFAFEGDETQEVLMKELALVYKGFQYELSREDLNKHMMFFLQ
jgi:hypothetical protein